MKKLQYIVIAAASLMALVSCHRETSGDKLVEWVFEAPATKAVLDRVGKFSWEASDHIGVWNAASSSFVSFTTVTGSGKFRAMAPADARFEGAAYYPEGIAKGPSKVSLGGEAMPMCAILEEGSNVLHFKHIGAFVSISVINLAPEAESLVIFSDATALSGDVTLSDGVWMKGGTPDYLRIPVGGESAVQQVIPVPVGSYSLTYVIENAAHEELLRRETSGDWDFGRAILYRFPVANMEPSAVEQSLATDLEAFDVEDDSATWE